MRSHGDRQGQIADFRDSFERIKWLYLHSTCGIKTKKKHFEWLLWHWTSLAQLNFESTRPSGLVGCKIPTDLVKISVKEATHMGFYCITRYSITRKVTGTIVVKYATTILILKCSAKIAIHELIIICALNGNLHEHGFQLNRKKLDHASFSFKQVQHYVYENFDICLFISCNSVVRTISVW